MLLGRMWDCRDRQWRATTRAIAAVPRTSVHVRGRNGSRHAWKTSPYLLPSLFTTLLATSNKQFGQYQLMISSA